MSDPTLTGHTDEVEACAVSPDGTWIVSASRDETLKIWDVATGTERKELAGHAGHIRACAVSPDGTWIVSTGDDIVKIWDVATGTEITTLTTAHTGVVWACAVSPDGTWFVTTGSDRTLKIWDVSPGDKSEGRALRPRHRSVRTAEDGGNRTCLKGSGLVGNGR